MLKIIDLKKRYRNFYALSGLDLEIGQGRIFGFVGPNGAGKTTTLKILAGLLKADSGQVLVDGVDVLRNKRYLRERIGYMPDFFGVYDNLKVSEYMEFYANANGLEGLAARQKYLELLDMVGLSDKLDFFVDGLSRGMKQRLCMARSLIHSPALVILDEPASGLDPRTRFEFKETLRNLQQTGVTVIVSSHILHEVSEVCTDIGIIEGGKMVVTGSMEEILRQVDVSRPLTITVCSRPEQAVELLKKNPLVQTLTATGNEITAGFGGDKQAEAVLLREMIEAGITVYGFSRQQGDLESVFMEITGGRKRRMVIAHEDEPGL